ncbi:MAG: ankyrin repeat domain-containing protein [bacterium]
MIAADNKQIEIVKMLLNNPNIDVNTQNDRKNTALMIAVSN